MKAGNFLNFWAIVTFSVRTLFYGVCYIKDKVRPVHLPHPKNWWFVSITLVPYFPSDFNVIDFSNASVNGTISEPRTLWTDSWPVASLSWHVFYELARWACYVGTTCYVTDSFGSNVQSDDESASIGLAWVMFETAAFTPSHTCRLAIVKCWVT